MNKVILVGNLTKDPELITTNSGISVCRFTIAISRRFPSSTGERETDFLNIVVWRNQAENCHKYLKKGSKCGVVGSIQTRSYEANAGTKKYVTEIVADEVEFLNSRSQNGEETSVSKPEKSEVSELEPIEDDSLPF